MKNFYYTLELNLLHPTIRAAYADISKMLSGSTFLQTRSRPYMNMSDAITAMQLECAETMNLIKEKNDGVVLEHTKLMNPLHFGEEMLFDEGEDGPTVDSLEFNADELEFWEETMLTSYTFTDPDSYGFTMRYILSYYDDPINEMLIGDPSTYYIQQNLSSTVH